MCTSYFGKLLGVNYLHLMEYIGNVADMGGTVALGAVQLREAADFIVAAIV